MQPFIQTVPPNDAAGIVEKQYEAARARTGYVSQIIQIMSLDPQVMQASMRFYVQLMKSPGALPKRQREMLAVVVSNANGCYY